MCEPGKPPTKPLQPATPTSAPSTSRMRCSRSSTSMPPDRSAATTSSRRFACQSWLPSTVRTGTSRSRTASARMAACSGSPWGVRSPARSTRSTSPRSPAKAALQRSRSASRPQCTSPVAAIRTRSSGASPRGSPFEEMVIRLPYPGSPCRMRIDDFATIEAALKRSAAALRDAGVPFLLGGSLASWARGGPETRHDLDLVIRPQDTDAATEALAGAGMRIEDPPEEWLVKAWDGDVLIDLIHHPKGLEVTDEVIARGDEFAVLSMEMRVMALEDVFTTKLMALSEHALRFESLLRMARALREQVDWEQVRSATEASPFARAFFVMLEGLDVLPAGGSAARAAG